MINSKQITDLINILYTKLYSFNYSIKSNGMINVPYSKYNHICIFYKNNIKCFRKIKILSFGINHFRYNTSIHAEQDAFNNLSFSKKNESINMLVIRLSKNNKLQSSKPCANCIKTLNELLPKKGYKIKSIYYSDSLENIVQTNIILLNQEEKHYSYFYKSTSSLSFKSSSSFVIS